MKQKRTNKKLLNIVLCILVITSGLATAGHVTNNTQIKNNVENYILLEKKPYSAPLNIDGNTLYVGGSGPNNYTKIQHAIDAAQAGTDEEGIAEEVCTVSHDGTQTSAASFRDYDGLEKQTNQLDFVTYQCGEGRYMEFFGYEDIV